MNIYYDCEFVENGTTIQLISIGMVREDGKTLYRIANNTPTIHNAIKHPWLRHYVIPTLPIIIFSNEEWDWDVEHTDIDNLRYTYEIAEDVKHFISNTPDPALWAYYGAYDHVALAQLFGTMVQLPTGIPMYTNDLAQEIARLGNPRIPEQTTTEHNALADAQWNKELHQYLLTLEGE